MKNKDILDLVRKQSVYVDKKSLSYTAGLGKEGIEKPKEELIDAAMEYVSLHRDFLNEYMLECRQGLALNPKTLEETLGCTEEERLRWTEDERLEVICCKEFGNEKLAPYYSIYQVSYEISEEILAAWREKDKANDRERMEEPMLKPLDWKTTSYEYKDGFIVDVIERETEDGLLYDVFLSHIDYSGRTHLFATLKKDLEKECINDGDGLSRLILNDIDEYIEIFCSDVMDREDLTEEDDYYEDMEWCFTPRGLMILDGKTANTLIVDTYASKYSLVHPESIEKVKEVYDAHYSSIVGKTFEEELEDLEWDDEMELGKEDFDYLQEDIALYFINKLNGSEWNYWRNLISELGIADVILDECFLRFERCK